MLSIKQIDDVPLKASGANLKASMTAKSSPMAIWVSLGHSFSNSAGVASQTTPNFELPLATIAHMRMTGPSGPGSKDESVQHLASDLIVLIRG